ncbi:indole-3-glycerol phosphate synthase TrpC [Sediminibacterium salmoneum]|uniref:indole-3-glycerol phosphate synthase TrpC n=1 Tax=Sediminibacterium salmoneum TaxID=426421 RepID=UPI00047A6947|nr:indole-3-glycerol phosphate synthase TrpC [Sediminibacterium salmoneum]
MTILDTIVEQKIREVAQRKAESPISILEQSVYFSRPCISLRDTLQDNNKTGIIAEYKRKSPSKGIINGISTVAEVTNAYAEYGAAAVSVLTDETFFGGHLNDLANAVQLPIPVLRKDFMVDEYQLYEAKAHGASVILLIAACLSPKDIQRMARLAHQLGLEVLLEIHGEDELGHICPEVDFVGVNNRNLKSFEVSLEHSLGLINKIPKEMPAIAESGIDHPDTIVTLQSAGFSGFLIGERFMRETNPGIAFANFVITLKEKQNAG